MTGLDDVRIDGASSRCGIDASHRAVSDEHNLWAYAGTSVRDLAAPVLASALIAIVPNASACVPHRRKNRPSAAREQDDHGHTIPRQCHSANPARTGQCRRNDDPNHRPVRSVSGAAARLGGLQGGTEPRHHSLRDLSGARPGPGASGIRLCGVAAAVSDRRGLCPGRPVRGAGSLRIEPPARTRRAAVRVGRARGAALALVRRHAGAGYAVAGVVRDLGGDRAGDLRRGVRLWRRLRYLRSSPARC